MVKITKKLEREVMNEDMASNVRAILEYVSVIPKIQETLDQHSEQLEKIVGDVEALKVGHRIMSQDIKEIKKDLKETVGREEFEEKIEKFERRALKTA